MTNATYKYDGVQSFGTRKFLSKWSSYYGWAAILTSVLLPAFGIFLSFVSLSFGLKRRDRIHLFPFVSLLASLGFLLLHFYLWAKLIYAL